MASVDQPTDRQRCRPPRRPLALQVRPEPRCDQLQGIAPEYRAGWPAHGRGSWPDIQHATPEQASRGEPSFVVGRDLRLADFTAEDLETHVADGEGPDVGSGLAIAGPQASCLRPGRQFVLCIDAEHPDVRAWRWLVQSAVIMHPSEIVLRNPARGLSLERADCQQQRCLNGPGRECRLLTRIDQDGPGSSATAKEGPEGGFGPA